MKQIKWDKEIIGLVIGSIVLLIAIGWSQHRHVTMDASRPDSTRVLAEELQRQKEMDSKLHRATERMLQAEQGLWELSEKLPQIKQHMTAKNVRLEAKTVAVANGSRLVAEYRNDGLTPRSSTFDVTVSSLVTAYEIDAILEGTGMAGLGRAFVEAEAESKINAMFLLALAIHESNWGSSAIAREKNNLFGFTAYDSNPYEEAASFRTKGDCVRFVARYLREHYIEGDYYHGTTIQNINQNYAKDRAWGEKIFETMTALDAKIQGLGLSK
ncbi:MAG: glucosaminidase domain-containing protein [Selenomonadales bacterium]|nr:glucosaminidase domain-containing protein [Selenomonadales bacterium]